MKTIFDPDPTGSDALAETIGGMFDIPEQDLDNQMVDMTSIQDTGSEKISQTPIENSDMASDVGDLF